MKVEPFDTQRHITFSRRAALTSGGMLVLFAGVVYRLYDLQVRRYDEFAAKADDNRFKQRIVVPSRGDIVDRYGKTVATSRQNFRVLFVPEEAQDVPAAVARLEQVLPLTARQEDQLLRQVAEKRNQAFVPIQVLENLSWEQFSAVNFHAPRLPGIVSDVGETRYYPLGEAVAPFVGHVGAAERKDLERVADQADRLLYLQPGFKLGKIGLEAHHDKALRGRAGTQTVEITAAGRVVDEDNRRGEAATGGDTLVLTIDAELQQKAMEVMAADYEEYPEDVEVPDQVSGAAVVIDVTNGDILVMASTPTFDPNVFARTIEAQTLRALENSPLKPMLCKPLAGAYPPASTFKLLSAIAAQEAGIGARTRYHCNGSFYFGGNRHGCWKSHGTVDMAGSIKHSCDVYYYNIGTRVDIDHIADVATRFGLGQTFNLGISGSVSGIVPSRDWKRRYYRSSPELQTWFPGETLSVAIGQGATTASPLQLAVMTARLATGRAVTPRIQRGIGDSFEPAPVFLGLNTAEEHLSVVRDGMDQVVNQWGTGSRSSLGPDYRMAGKTGTGQVRSLRTNPKTGKYFKNEELPWRERDHALFVAFAPFDNPRYACTVVVEHGGSGSKSAGPRARDIMRAVLEKDPGNTSKNPLYWPEGQEPPRIASAATGAGTP